MGKAALAAKKEAGAGATAGRKLVGPQGPGPPGRPRPLPGPQGRHRRRRSHLRPAQPHPRLPVAMAYVDVEHTEPGTALDIDLRGRPSPSRSSRCRSTSAKSSLPGFQSTTLSALQARFNRGQEKHMARVAPELQYSDEHEWVAAGRPSDCAVSGIGISAVAADALGDIVYVDLPEVGATVTAGETCGEVESTKSVSDLYAPVTGEVTEINHGRRRRPRADQQRPLRCRLALQGAAEPTRPAALRRRSTRPRTAASCERGRRHDHRRRHGHRPCSSRSFRRAWTPTCPPWTRRSPRRSTPS